MIKIEEEIIKHINEEDYEYELNQRETIFKKENELDYLEKRKKLFSQNKLNYNNNTPFIINAIKNLFDHSIKEELLICPHCDFTTEDEAILNNHKILIHQNGTILRMKAMHPSKQIYNLISSSNRETTCEYCNIHFAYTYSLILHLLDKCKKKGKLERQFRIKTIKEEIEILQEELKDLMYL